MESREEEPDEETQRSFLKAKATESIQAANSLTDDTTSTSTATAVSATSAADGRSDDEETGDKPLISTPRTERSEDEEEEECGGQISVGNEEAEQGNVCKEDEEDKEALWCWVAGRSGSMVSDDLPSVFLSPSPEDEDDQALDFDLDAIETPSDSESLPFPMYDLDLEDDLRRLGVASSHHRGHSSRSDPQTGCLMETDQSGLGFLEREDVVDSHGTRWRCFTTGDPPQESRVNMSVLEPFLRVLSHGGYYGDGMNDIIVFSSCYLPENCLENYQYVMDNLFRFVVGTLELMVAENYVIVYLCAGGQKDKLPGISWLRECYTTIDRRLRKNLKGFYVVHPTWYIKALITIIKPFISTKFSRKLQFISSLKELSNVIPTEHVQIPDCVKQYDDSLSR
uniref:CRAL-TRIO domain-containing protein n=1 Tax=Astatotilapia calliptera TaxID=8154 RepID=A0A3P8PCA1_ASTCA